MTIIQFLDRVTEKIQRMNMTDEIDSQTGICLRSDRATVLSHLNPCRQIAAHKGTKFWRVPNMHFKVHWFFIQGIILKHDLKFFDEFKDDDQARAELKEILGIK